MSNQKPGKIGRYEVQSLVGEGATAAVFKAHDPAIDRTVAIKLLKQEYRADQEFSARFQREAQSAGAISHPNIVTIYDVGQVGGTPYIAMEFLNEKSLAELMAGGTRLSVKKVLAIGIQLAGALDFAHRRGVIHRDVKPANILHLNDGDTVKLTDFGIARFAGGDDAQRTQMGSVLGTPRYMSPEQAGGQPVDGRSDLFSLGAILYELLTGTHAFDHHNLALVLLQILQKDPPAPSRLSPDVPRGVDRVIMKLLSKRPEHRYQTGALLAQALDRELLALLERESAKSRNSFLPLRVKLALRASAALAVVFMICMSVVYTSEKNVLRRQTLDSGAALAKFVAVEAAVPVLGQNWLPLKLFVQDAKARGSFDFLAIVDHMGVVEASTDGTLVGNRFVPPARGEIETLSPGMAITSVALGDGTPIFLFNTPILFQKTPIGTIYLGVDRAQMDHVLQETFGLLLGLGFLAIAAVGSLSYLFGIMLAKPMRVLRNSLLAAGAGDLDHRISQPREDELGELFAAFNHMVEGMQGRVSVPDAPPRWDIADFRAQLPEAADQSATLVLPS